MATVATANNVARAGFCVNVASDDLTGCESANAAVTGKSHYLQSVLISSDGATNFTIGAGETAGAVTTTIFGPVYIAANSTMRHVFAQPVKLAAATALTVDAGGAANCCVVVEGYTE